MAVRPGVVYTPDGRARINLRPGKTTVFASRGFEYSAASRTLDITEGQQQSIELSIRREVPTPGLVACDTHVHTLTHSGHGDASVEERVVTLAGEGIELPIATDHDIFADLDPVAAAPGRAGLLHPGRRRRGDDPVGHFNAFPFPAGRRFPTPAFPTGRVLCEPFAPRPRRRHRW